MEKYPLDRCPGLFSSIEGRRKMFKEAADGGPKSSFVYTQVRAIKSSDGDLQIGK